MGFYATCTFHLVGIYEIFIVQSLLWIEVGEHLDIFLYVPTPVFIDGHNNDVKLR